MPMQKLLNSKKLCHKNILYHWPLIAFVGEVVQKQNPNFRGKNKWPEVKVIKLFTFFSQSWAKKQDRFVPSLIFVDRTSNILSSPMLMFEGA
jgi:hypothetical protein